MAEFLAGIATCGSWGIAAFFFRFWRETRDRFFALFAAAFLILSVNWLLVAILQPPKTHRDGATSFYLRDPAGTTVQIIHLPNVA